MTAALDVSGLVAGYDRTVVVRDLSLSVEAGKTAVVIGPNGHGKTTMLLAISGLIRPMSGSITLGDERIDRSSAESIAGMGVVHIMQGDGLFADMTVEENLLMGAHKRKDPAGVARSFAWVYELFPILADRRRQLAGNMSGGEQQMCAIARALMAAPRLLMIDEMSLGLAPVIVDQLLEILDQIRRQSVAIFLVEQDVFAAFSIADRGYVMETGRIVRAGTAAELSKDPAVRAAYLGIEAGA